MNIYAFILFVESIVSIILAYIVLLKSPRSKLNRYYSLFALVIGYWDLVSFGVFVSESYEVARFWSIFDAFWVFAVVFILRFFLEFTENTKLLKNKIVLLLTYGVAILSSIIDLPTHLFTGDPLFYEDYWYLGGGDFWLLTEFWAYLVFAFCVYLSIKFYRKTEDTKKKAQIRVIFSGFVIATFFATLGEMCYYFQDICTDYPILDYASYVPPFFVLSLFIGFAVWKYELFALDLATAADNIVSTMSDALFLLNKKNEMVIVNNGAMKLLGYKKEDLVGKKIDDIFGKENYDHVVFNDQVLKDLQEKGRVVDFDEISLTTKGERNIPISLSCSLIRDRNKETLGVVCIARDITARKREETLLQDSHQQILRAKAEVEEKEAKSEAILLAVGEGLIVTDKEGKITLVNRSFEKLTGWKSSEVIGKPIAEAAPLESKDGKRVTQEERMKPLRMMPGKKVESLKKTYYTKMEDIYFVKKDGSKFRAEVTSTPIIFRWDTVGFVEVFEKVD